MHQQIKMNLKDQKLAGILAELAAEYINRESNKNSLITVTRAEVLNKGKKAIIFFSVFPDAAEESSKNFLLRHRGDFRSFVLEKKVVAFAPSIDFQIDYGEKNRQRIDELSQN